MVSAVFFGVLSLSAAAKEVKPATTGDYMCQCEFKDNNWAYQMTALLKHVQDLPMALQKPDAPESIWITKQGCDEDARVFPNTDIIANIEDVLQLQRAAQFPSSGGRLEAHHLCLPGQVAMMMVCAQQYLMKRNLRSVLKWVGKMADILSIVRSCMDSDSPLPLRAAEFEEYLTTFQASIPLPESPSFVPMLAWPHDARLKGYDEAQEPLLECLPMKDPKCFPRHTSNAYESCSECCSPRHGARGHVECWVGEYSYERCCTHSPRPWEIETEQSQCRGADKKNKELQKALDAEIKQARELGKSHGSLKEELRGCMERQQLLSKKLHDVERAFNATKMSLAEEGEALPPAPPPLLPGDEEEAKEDIASVKELASLRDELRLSQVREENLTKLLQTRLDEALALNASVLAAQVREENLTKQLRMRRDEVSALNRSVLVAQEREANLTKQLQATREEASALNVSLSAFQVNKDNSTKQLQAKFDEISAVNASFVASRARESNLTKELHARLQDIADMNASLLSSQEQLRELRKQAEARGEESATRDADLLQAKEQVEQLKAQLQERDRDLAAKGLELQKAKALCANAAHRPESGAGDHRAAAAAAAAALAAAAAADQDADAGVSTVRIAGGQELPLPASWLAALLGECAPVAAGNASSAIAADASVKEPFSPPDSGTQEAAAAKQLATESKQAAKGGKGR